MVYAKGGVFAFIIKGRRTAIFSWKKIKIKIISC